MTFTQFVRDTTRPGPRPSFLQLARHDGLWPSQSNRLEDFESFLLSALEEEGAEVIPELRELWSRYADAVGRAEGKHDLDLAVAAWGDYARHLRVCSGTTDSPCETLASLLEDATEVSTFEDHPSRAALECAGVDDVQALDEDLDSSLDDEEGEWERPDDLQ